MLEKEGATALRCPMVSILDAPDPAPVLAWLRELIAGRFGYVVLLTGEGFRRLRSLAEREGLRQPMLDAFAKTRTITRGPKPVRALKEVGLSPSKIAESPTTEGVIATLRLENVKGQTIGVQLYSDANPPLVEYLQSAGATVRTVQPYVYAPKADTDRVADLIHRLARKEIDCLVFTSAPQVERLFEAAGETGLQDELTEGLRSTRVAAVGPVVADDLRRHGVKVDICPEQGFVMKNLVQHIRRELAP